MAREVLSNGVINPDKYQADWYADLSNNWNLLNNLIGSAISGSEVDSKIATAIQELMIRTFQIVAELPATGTEGVMYLVLIPDTSKYTAYVWENSAYRELGVIQMTITIDDELSTTSENPAQNKVITNALNNKAPISHTHSASDITSGLATVATSGSYNDLSNKPTIPSKTSDLTNDSGFITSDNTKIPLAGSNQISGSLIPSTDNSIDVGSSTKNIKMLYTKGITINGTQFLPSDYIPKTGSNAISGSLIPSTDGTVNLGSVSYQWNQAYIKSLTINGVACGDILTHNASEFVNISSNQTIDGNKTFIGRLTYKSTNTIAGDSTSSNFAGSFNFIDKNDVQLGTLGLGVFNNNGYTEQALSIINPLWFNDNTKTKSFAVRLRIAHRTGEVSFIPVPSNTIDLGSTSYKWKSLNGIAPDELGLPTSTYTDVSSYITNFDSTPNDFTAPVSGLFFIEGNNSTPIECAVFNNTKGYIVNASYVYSNMRGLIPVEKGDNIGVYINDPINLTSAKIFHLKGKV